MDHRQDRLSIYPLVSRLEPDDTTLTLQITLGRVPTEGEWVRLSLYHLHRCIRENELLLRAGQQHYQYELDLPRSELPEGCIGLGITAADALEQACTAVDLGTCSIRYGFVSDFTTDDLSREPAVMENLLKHHITHVQFYDWHYRPHQYAPDDPQESCYEDMMGKPIDLHTVRSLLERLHRVRMKGLGYGAVYAAGREYLSAHPEEALYDLEGNTFDLIDTFFIMNPANHRWCDHLIEQYRYAVEQLGFDGIHMDTYGYPKVGWGYELKQPVRLEREFVKLIDRWAAHGDENIFNNVGGWPAGLTAAADQAACYIEVWEPHTCYRHLRSLIQRAAVAGKPVILAAYLAPFRQEHTPEVLASALYLNAEVSAAGATSLLLGQEHALLTAPYYSDYGVLTPEEAQLITDQYDMQVRYQELLYSPDLQDITESHALGADREFGITTDPRWPVSIEGEPNGIHAVVKRSDHRVVINLINMIDQVDACWNAPKHPCSTRPALQLMIPKYGTGMRIWWCSPEHSLLNPTELEITPCEGVRGPSVSCTIEELPLWSLIWCDWE